MTTQVPTSRADWQAAAQALRQQFDRLARQTGTGTDPAARQTLLETWLSSVLFYYTALFLPDEQLFERDSLHFYEDFQTAQTFYWKHRFDAAFFRQLGFEEWRQPLYEAVKHFALQQLPVALGYRADWLRRPPVRADWLAYCHRFRSQRGQAPGYFTSSVAGRVCLAFARSWAQGVVANQAPDPAAVEALLPASVLIRLPGEEPLTPAPAPSDRRRRLLDEFWQRSALSLPRDQRERLALELEYLSDAQVEALRHLPLVPPGNALLASFFLGFWGIDRLMLGKPDWPLALIKFFTFGGLGILWLYDVITAVPRIREHNYNRLAQELNRV